MKEYLPIKPGEPCPEWWIPAQRDVNDLLVGCAEVFASNCRATPNRQFPKDAVRRPVLLYNRGLGRDESTAFLRARQHGLVEVRPDSNFLIPNARECSKNLHLLSRNGDHFRVNNEALIHIGAYAELILDRGWKPSMLVFDPFFNKDALDLRGYAAPCEPKANWRDGRITFVAEAKARVQGPDSADTLSNLFSAFEQLQKDQTAHVEDRHRRKWNEVVRIVAEHGKVEMLLVADGVRWWYEARPTGTSVALHRLL